MLGAAAIVLGEDHPATVALSRASETMDRVDLWHAKLAMKTLRRDQREAIAEAVRRVDPTLVARPWASAARLCVSRGSRVG